MKAILVTKPFEVTLTDIDRPELTNPDDVLVKMTAVGICGSDIHIIHGTHPYVQYPRIIGHEGAGIIFQVGSNVKDLKIGDPVVIEPIKFCSHCYACKKGRHNVCKDLKVTGVHEDGTYEEYILLPAKQVYKYDPSLKATQAVLAEPYTIGAQANARAGTKAGDLVLVHGAGPIGLITCDLAHEAGAKCIVSDINEDRLELAKKFGAYLTVNPLKEDLQKIVMRESNEEGANIIFDAAGAPGIIESALEMASQAGTIVPMTFGSKPIPMNFGLVNKKELTICGTRMECERFDKVLASFPSRRDRLDLLVTHVFPINKYEEAFKTSTDKAAKACKVVMTFED